MLWWCTHSDLVALAPAREGRYGAGGSEVIRCACPQAFCFVTPPIQRNNKKRRELKHTGPPIRHNNKKRRELEQARIEDQKVVRYLQ